MAENPIQKSEVQAMIDAALHEGDESLVARLGKLEQNFTAKTDLDFSNVNLLQKPQVMLRSLRWKAYTPSQITANQDNYNTGDAPVLRLATDASRNITGLTNGTDGRLLLIINIGSYNIVIKNESSSSTAANRITTISADITIQPKQQLQLWYDLKSSRWRPVSLSQDASTATDSSHQSFTAGEAIDASSTPQAVYLKASDGKVYKLNATSAGEAAMDFIGFVDAAQNVASNGSASVLTANRAICAGFSGLTVGAYYFSTNTGGTISATAGTNPVLVGQAVSATTLLIMTAAKHMEGVPATLGNYLTTSPSAGNVTDQVTVGFRPRIIKLYYYLQPKNGGISGLPGRKGIVMFIATTQQADFCIFNTVATAGHNMTGDDGNVQNIDGLIATTTSTTAPTAGDLLSNNGVKFTLSLSALDDASFTINLAIALATGYVSAGDNYRCRIYYEAFQ